MRHAWVWSLLVCLLGADVAHSAGIIPSWMRRDKSESAPRPIVEEVEPVILRPPTISDLRVEPDQTQGTLLVLGQVKDDAKVVEVLVNGVVVTVTDSEFVYQVMPLAGNNTFTVEATDSDGLTSEASINFFVADRSRQIGGSPETSEDKEPPLIEITETRVQGSKVVRVTARVTDNVALAEVLLDQVPPDSIDGDLFTWDRFIPASGLSAEIVAYDIKGLQSSRRFEYQRSNTKPAGTGLAAIDPFRIKPVKPNPNRVALIIGIESYRTAVEAKYAVNDAEAFQNYAEIALGVPAQNMKLLTNEQATRSDILLALKSWLPRVTTPGESELFVFFAGHGMPTADGESAFIVPFDANVLLLEDTGISRKRLYAEVDAVRPKSVMLFFDNCYGGTNRDDKLLLASRPMSIKVEESPVPPNYLVFNAGESDQTAGVLDEVKHGRFSYFLFKGLEGEADRDRDDKITAGELQAFVRESVRRYSAGSQTPTMLGNTERLVVRK